MKNKGGNSRPGVLAKKLRRCEEEGGRSKVGQGGPVTPSPLPPTPTVNFARTPAVKVVRSTTTSTPSSKKGGASQGVVEEFQWNSSAARTLYCGQNPCDWVLFESEICEECEESVEQKHSNKEVQFHTYQLPTRFRFRVL
jgi:hypothetical protein